MRKGGQGSCEGSAENDARWAGHLIAILAPHLGGGCKLVHLGAHSPITLTTTMLAPYHSPLPCLCTTCPSHINTCMPHVSIACGMRPTSVMCCACVAGYKLIFVAGQSSPTTQAPQPGWSFRIVKYRKNDVVCITVVFGASSTH